MAAMHTPGPWKVITTPYATGERYQIVHGRRRPIAVTIAGERPHHKVMADAKLIAAAPELFTALEDAIEFMESVDPDSFTLRDARAALAKAGASS